MKQSKIFEQAHLLNPDNLNIQLWLGRAFIDQGQVDLGIEFLEAVVNLA